MLGGRFEIAEVAGQGGMATVYRALDRDRGEPVAVKVLLRTDGDGAARFSNEVRVLAELHHPLIVRYVMHGVTAANQPYLVMEWLDGESLEQRLRWKRLGLHESLELLRCVASALAAAHERGVVHRDIKPSNIFLERGEIGRAKLLDFGIALFGERVTMWTQSRGIIGTPGYMAPEQARGEAEDVGTRADVFSLGAVLFECLTGRPAFQGAHVAALLAKVLWDDAPRIRELAPEAPEALDALVARMLAKDPMERPPDAAAVLHALDHLGEEGVVAARPPPAAVTRTERRLVSVVAIKHGALLPARRSLVTLPESNAPRRLLAEVRKVVTPFGARVEELANGVLMALLVGAGNALDQAALAARAALRLRTLLPDARLTLVTGWAEEAGRLPVGEVLERAGSLLAKAAGRDEDDGGRYGPVHVDEVTQALLSARFDVVRHGDRILLRGEADDDDQARTLLGKPSAFLGRDREIRNLLDLVQDSFEERKSRAILVTAEAGMGKSRIRHELARRVRAVYPDVAVGIGRGDSINAGSALGMLASALRSTLQITPGEPAAAQREKLSFGVGVVVEEAEAAWVTELLGEMIGAPFPGAVTPRLRAARQNASIMAGQIQAAYVEYMGALAGRRPALLLLEDLHWGDEASVKLVDVALRDLSQLPFVVVAFARPNVHDVFPKLWRGRELSEVRLGGLPRRAAAQLVDDALGKSIRESAVAGIVERAGGNVFYLEELIRAAAEGRAGGLPETILGMVEARISSLPPDSRRVLRAASVFGKVFWKRAVQDLLGESGEYGRGARFEDLVDQELFVRHAESRFPGEEQYAFRHALIREGAYAMLADRDRALAHRRAAEWLELAGETDAMTLAAHYERGEETIRAGEFYLRAAELAHRAGDTAASMSRAKRGLLCGVPEGLKLDLLGLLSELHIWRNEWGVAAGYGEDVFHLAQTGSTPWIRAATARLVDAMNQGEVGQALGLVDAICESRPGPDSVDPAALALALGVALLVTMGRASSARRVLDRLHALVEPFHGSHPTARAWMHLAHPRLEAWIHEDPVAGLMHSEAAQQSFREAHYERGERLSRVFIGMNTWRLGNREAAERALRQEVSTEAEFALVASLHSLLLSMVLAAGGKIEEAKSEALRLIETSWSHRVSSDEGRGHWAMAEALMCEGDLDGAEREAESAVRMLEKLPLDRAAVKVTLSAIQLKRGDSAQALQTARRAAALHGEMGVSGYRGALARLTLAECLHATGERAEARRSIAEARALLLKNAERIPDPGQRQRFLQDVPENRRTLELFREWLE